MDNPSLFDSLCNRLMPYVSSALKDRAKAEPRQYPGRAELESLLGLEEQDEHVREFVLDEFCEAFASSDKDLDTASLYTDILAATWSDTLRIAYKEDRQSKLRDCLLPENLGHAERAWRIDIDHIGFTQKQVEDILRKFGNAEIAAGLELPHGGYIRRVADGYELSFRKE